MGAIGKKDIGNLSKFGYRWVKSIRFGGYKIEGRTYRGIIAQIRLDSLSCNGVAFDLQFSAEAVERGQNGIISESP